MRSYVPILKWKQGEQRALRTLAMTDKATCIPVLELLGEAFETEEEPLADVCTNICAEIAKNWGTTPVFIDFDDDLDAQVVTAMFNAGRGRQLALVPVTSLWRSAPWQAAVAATIRADGRGVCFRVSPEEVYDTAFSQAILQLATTLGVSLNVIDIVLDWEAIAEDEGPRTAITARAALAFVPQVASWRSITFAASSFPKLLSSVGVGRGLITRAEWQAHGLILQAPNLQRSLAFGDYAIAHPVYEPTQFTGSAAIRYTIDAEWLIYRGTSLRLPNAYQQFPAMCRLLVADPEYRGAGFSWGDDQIAQYAAGTLTGTGNLSTWRAVGTNHHVTFAARQTANRFSPSGRHAPPHVGP